MTVTCCAKYYDHPLVFSNDMVWIQLRLPQFCSKIHKKVQKIREISFHIKSAKNAIWQDNAALLQKLKSTFFEIFSLWANRATTQTHIALFSILEYCESSCTMAQLFVPFLEIKLL